MNMRHFVSVLIGFVLFLTASCQSTDAPPEVSSSTETTVNNSNPGMIMHLSLTDTLPYPIVADFDDLAPIFSRTDDKIYVINFWATWCGPCVEELPYFEKLAEETNSEEVEIVMVSLDFRRDVRTKLLKFVKERPFNLPVIALTDTKTNLWIDKVDPEWGGAIPITIVYRQDKRLFFPDQFANYEELLNAVQSFQ
jgi:thiol-disulfide isomerase/thioredoxin